MKFPVWQTSMILLISACFPLVSRAEQAVPPIVNPAPVTEVWQNVQLVRTLDGHDGTVESLVFSPDSKMLSSGGSDNDGKIKLWWVRTGTQIDSLRAHRTAVNALVLSPDGETLVSCSDDSGINLWNWKTGSYTRTLLEHSSNVLALAVSADNQTLISGGLDGIRVWDLRSQRPRYTLARFDAQTYALAANGDILASGGKNGLIKLWNLNAGTEINSWLGHSNTISALVFAPDGQTLVSGSYDRSVKVWERGSGKLLYHLLGHTDKIQAIAIHPSGQILASASRDGIRLWNLQTGELLRFLSSADGGHKDWVRSLAFSPDGLTLASGGFDKKIMLWQINF
jgi:WD40 repeat protein